jgi:IS30 family transposase
MGEVYSHLSEEERQVIQIEIGNGTSIRRIGLMLGRNASTVFSQVGVSCFVTNFFRFSA